MRSALVRLLLAGVCLLVSAPAAAAQMSLASPPPGANNFACRPTQTHPRPVVLVHGLGATMRENWSYVSPLLAARGYCVFALTYGLDPRFPYFGGAIPIEQSAQELAAFVTRVRDATGAQQVDLVGHSEGTFMPEYWLKYLGGAPYVHAYVAMTPLYHGTNLLGLASMRDVGSQFGLSQPVLNLFGRFCGSCSEFLAGSSMVRKLNAGPGGSAVPASSTRRFPLAMTSSWCRTPAASSTLPTRSTTCCRPSAPTTWTSTRQRRSTRWWRS